MRPRAGLAVIGGTRGVRLAATRSAVVVAVVIGLSSGCATIRRHSTLETEQMLSAAGESGAASRPTSGSERVLQRAVQEIAVPGRPRLPDELPGEEVAVACVEL